MIQRSTGTNSVRLGRDVLRVKEQALPGTMIEIDIGALAIAIGPESDVPSVTIAYIDENAVQATEILRVATGAPFIGRLDATLAAQFPGSSLQGRLVAYPTDQMPDFTRFFYTGFNQPPAPADVFYVQKVPILDLLAYSSNNVAGVPRERGPLNYCSRVSVPDTSDAGSLFTNYNIPIYGRRALDVEIVTNNIGNDYSIEINGFQVIDSQGVSDVSLQAGARTILVATTALPNIGLSSFPLDLEALGFFDILNIAFVDATGTIDVSANYTTATAHRQIVLRVKGRD